METCAWSGYKLNPPALKPSLEGWKHAPVTNGYLEHKALETFLRGMETYSLFRGFVINNFP